MLKYAAQLSESYELALVWWGQSNARPRGSLAEGVAAAPHLALAGAGQDLTGVVVATGSGTETLTVGSTLTAYALVGARLHLGTPASPVVGYGTVTANGTGTVTVTWTVAATPGTYSGYAVFLSMRGASYAGVRVLTPYQPDQGGSYPTGTPVMPGFEVSEEITSYEDLAAFLRFSFSEGVAGYGVTEAGGASYLAASATSNSLTLAGTPLAANVLAGGYLRVDHAGGTSWTTIGTNTTGVLNGLSWQGAGTPSGTASAWTWDAWLPHHQNSPHHYLPGKGFRYPSNDMQPQDSTRNRPRGVTSAQYSANFGAMIACAWRIAQVLGRRINVIHLGIDGAGLVRTADTFGGSPGQVGWWSSETFCDFNPSATDGLAQRLKRLLTVAAPAALEAEGSTKTLKVLGVVQMQGEKEAGNLIGRELYADALPAFYQWLRAVIDGAGLSPYPTGVQVPVVIAAIPSYPWEQVITSPITYEGDTEGMVNAAITAFAAKHWPAATLDTNNSPQQTLDPLHFDGEGEAMNGELAADALLPLVDRALAQAFDAGAIEVVNQALQHIGDAGRVVSLDPPDNTAQARQGAKLLPKCRDTLLEMHAWKFALRRQALVEVDNELSVYAHAYVLPRDLVKAIAVVPADATDDFLETPARSVLEAGYPVTWQELTAMVPTPYPFHMEVNAEGVMLLYTDLEDAVLRYGSRCTDSSHWSPTFSAALSWYIASLFAPSLMRGAEGAAEGRRCLERANGMLSIARRSDAQQRRRPVEWRAPWHGS